MDGRNRGIGLSNDSHNCAVVGSILNADIRRNGPRPPRALRFSDLRARPPSIGAARQMDAAENQSGRGFWHEPLRLQDYWSGAVTRLSQGPKSAHARSYV